MSPVLRLVRTMGQHDHDVLVAWTLSRRPATGVFMRAVTHTGDAVVVITLCLVLMALGDPALRDAGTIGAFTLALSHGWVQIVKRAVGRPRPRLPAGAPLLEAPDRFSFPSGHAAAGLSLALPLAAVAPQSASVPLLGIGLLVGLSRCYLGVHYPGDVIAGWTLALAAYLAAPAGLAALAGLVALL